VLVTRIYAEGSSHQAAQTCALQGVSVARLAMKTMRNLGREDGAAVKRSK